MLCIAAAALLAACQAPSQSDAALRLIFADDFGVSFTAHPTPDRTPTEPVEIELWAFSDKQDPLTASWGWDTAWTRTRVDCQAGAVQSVLHRTYKDGELVEEVTPTAAPRRVTGIASHSATLDAACNPQAETSAVTAADETIARAWADRHYDAVRGGGK